MWALLLCALWSTVLVRAADESRIQRISAFQDHVAIGRGSSIAIHRHNGTNVDLSLRLYHIPFFAGDGSLSEILYLKLVDKTKLIYCDESACWLCALKGNRTHRCQGYYVSRNTSKMASAECVITNASMIVRFLDVEGKAAVVKFTVSTDDNEGPIYPAYRADDLEDGRVKNQTLVGSFHEDGFTYFVESADRVYEPSCLLTKKPSPCTDFRKSVRVVRICDDDETERLESKTEITLGCDSESAKNIALASYFQEYNGFVTVVFGSPSSSVASICNFMVDDIAHRFEKTWDICQNITTPDVKKCRQSPDRYPECQITSKDFQGGHSLCRRYINAITSNPSIDICSLQKYTSHEHRHCWLENFAPLRGTEVLYSLNLEQSQLVTLIDHSPTDSYFVLRKAENGSARIDRMRGDSLGLYLTIAGVSNIRSVWNTTGVDAIPMVFDSFSRAIFFSRDDSVEIQPINCKGLYKTCEQIPRLNDGDPLDCVWCQDGAFSLPRIVQGMCPKSSLYLDDCPGDNPASSGTVAPRTTAIPNGPEGDKHGVTFVLKMVIAGVSCLVGLTLLVVGAYFFWRRKRRRSRKESDEQSQESPLVALASIPGIYESCAPALPRDYLSMFERFPSDKKINLKHLTIDWNHPIGEGYYGKVYRGIYQKEGESTSVACKTVNLRDSSTGDFLREAEMMSVLDHPRVLAFVGICFGHGQRTILVTKFMGRGDLSHFLMDRDNPVTLEQLLYFCAEVAEGMEYIHSKEIIHRDLAARNCMLDEDLHVCVADFGLARFTEDNVYEVRTNRPLPISILSIEALAERRFTKESDVWAFGNLLWETLTLGCPPWKGVASDDLLARLKRGERLPRHDYWPTSIYNELMLPCWNESEAERPTFGEILRTISFVLQGLRSQANTSYEVPRSAIPEGSEISWDAI